jgi:hypothetical protein
LDTETRHTRKKNSKGEKKENKWLRPKKQAKWKRKKQKKTNTKTFFLLFLVIHFFVCPFTRSTHPLERSQSFTRVSTAIAKHKTEECFSSSSRLIIIIYRPIFMLAVT